MVQFSIRNRLTVSDPGLPLLPPAVTAVLRKLGTRLFGFSILLSGCVLALALATYDPSDPSWNTSVTLPEDTGFAYANWLGASGAALTDTMLQWVGTVASWMVTSFILLRGVQMMGGFTSVIRGSAWLLLPLVLVIAAVALGTALIQVQGNLPLEGIRIGAVWQLVAEAGNPIITAQLGASVAFLTALSLIALGAITYLVIAGFRRQQAVAAGRLIGRTARGGMARLSKRREANADRGARDDIDHGPSTETELEGDQQTTNETTKGPKLNLPGKKPATIEIDDEEAPRRKAKAEQTAQPSLGLASTAKTSKIEDYEAPSLSLLYAPTAAELADQPTEDALQANAGLLEGVLADFGVKGEIQKVRPGPVVTLYELEPAPGTKSQRVIGIADDIARSMSAISARVAVVAGKNAIGIELPNETRQTVWLHEVLADRSYTGTKCKLPLALGKDIGGEPVIADLARMPHLLVAGTTGSGKSVAVNTMILSLLYRLSPEQCRFIMIDPKMLELSVYADIPHLLCPVVTEPKKAVVALKWVVREMEDRYRAMSKLS
ncbi:MAG: DNA translocase FtsK 4TM domain-containing protein, partial [Pseudomonadota bacterium]